MRLNRVLNSAFIAIVLYIGTSGWAVFSDDFRCSDVGKFGVLFCCLMVIWKTAFDDGVRSGFDYIFKRVCDDLDKRGMGD